MKRKRRPTPEAREAADLLAPLPDPERERVLHGLRIALGLEPMPEVVLKPSGGVQGKKKGGG